ncbi:ATP-binding protein [Tenacibaculum sp. ZS6-P6]|uniref:sensor histidine kinase n=1 Tax=Tenacibaculum sp. ZS6-P6 TaxID=3447503 RepID=UPI003F9D1A00
MNRFYSQTTQRLNANVANHLIEEKFKNTAPFLENGDVNVELFDDVMHDMMAVNRAIEVYLLDIEGVVLHSVVLDHSDEFEPIKKVDLIPIREFIKNKNEYILGDDPKNTSERKIFSAASFNNNGKQGYIYVLLASHDFEQICTSLFKSYFSKLTITTICITTFLSLVVGFLSIFFISKSLLIIIHHVNNFKEGNLQSRIPEASTTNLSILATTFNEMADTIAYHIEEIKSINNFKKELIANISHDLRTPLTIIRGYAETLSGNEIKMTKENRQDFLKIIEKSTFILSDLVNQLYEYSNLDAKELQLNKTKFNLPKLINEIVMRYGMISENKEISIKVICKLDENQFVFGDKLLIERVIQNILDNALKFTPQKGCITLSLETKLDKIIVSIKDSGLGITKTELDSVLDRWYTSGNTIESRGLGLAISKKIIELHGTHLMIFSEGKNKGSEFMFSLPNTTKLIN